MNNGNAWKKAFGYENIEVTSGGLMRNTKTGRFYRPPKINKYHFVVVGNKSKPAHRIIWETFNGRIPAGKVINHKNRIKFDNRIENLEVITQQSNIWHGLIARYPHLTMGPCVVCSYTNPPPGVQDPNFVIVRRDNQRCRECHDFWKV